MAAKSNDVPRPRKRGLPAVYNGVSSSYEEKNSDFLCPVCFETIEEAHMTKCGHTFCFKCISASLDQSNRCPKCNFVIEKKDQLFPNFVLNELITKHKKQLADKKVKYSGEKTQCITDFQDFMVQDTEKLDLHSVNYMLDVLSRKKNQLVNENREAEIQLLKEFLTQVRKQKSDQLSKLSKELNVIDEDLKSVQELYISQTQRSITKGSDENGIWYSSDQPSSSSGLYNNVLEYCSSDTSESLVKREDGFNGSQHSGGQHLMANTMASRRKRMHMHFDDLEQCYFSTRTKELSNHTSPINVDARKGLDDFSSTLHKFTKYSSVRPLSTLNYASDLFNGSSIVSTIEFDKDNEFFAIAGVTKKIKLYEYSSVVQDTIDIHYPMIEMLCNSKISCISWSSYHKGMLASSDYEGSVLLWDAFTGKRVKLFQEHEKRCWSVDFNKVDNKLIASGSDDSRVKLWDTNSEHSITCLEAKANVCCVKFNPEKCYHLAYGSADHFVHYYDLRNTKQALGIFRGHKKAVSYVKFLSSQELVSASTDSQLKLWDVEKPHCLRSFKGHLNEKNFVGLATDNDYIACGSENNSLYVYYKGLTKQVLSFRFDSVKSSLDNNKKEEDTNEFVSAVCWRTGTNVVVAANSQGTIKVLELV